MDLRQKTLMICDECWEFSYEEDDPQPCDHPKSWTGWNEW